MDYRGITVAQIAELRSNLRAADATFTVVKNSLTERAADQVGAEALKEFLAGPTALTFVRGDAAVAAKAIADYARTTQLLPFKGGLMDGSSLDVEQIRALSRLPSREVLYGQLVGVVASPVSGLVRTLAALLGGLAVALGQVREKKESGEIPAGEAPAPAETTEPAAEAPAPAEAEERRRPRRRRRLRPRSPAQRGARRRGRGASRGERGAARCRGARARRRAAAEASEEPAQEAQAEPAEEPEQQDDNHVDAEAEAGPEDAAADTNKED